MTWTGTESNSLTAVRSQIHGFKQSVGSSGGTQTFNVVEANPQGGYSYILLVDSILQDTFVEASYMFIHTNGHVDKRDMSLSRKAYAFITGTGLEIMLQSYGGEYNADELRATFYQIFHIKS